MSTAVSSPRMMLHSDPATEAKYLKAPPLVIPVMSPQSSTPGPKTPPTTVPRKLVDMLSPLLRGRRPSSASPNSTLAPSPTATTSPTAPYSPAALPSTPVQHTPSTPPTTQPWLTQTPPTPTYHSSPPGSATLTNPSADPDSFRFNMYLSDTGGHTHTRTSPTSIPRAPQNSASPRSLAPTPVTRSPTKAPSPVPAPPTPGASPSPARPAGYPSPSPSAFTAVGGPGQPSEAAAAALAAAVSQQKPMATFPALARLCNAARMCALPPSRTVPEAGTPNYPTEMLALSVSVPPRMTRPSWCLADYAIVEKLYKGYASTVYKAFCKHSSDVVVLKVYTLGAVCDLYKWQIYREVRLHSGLQHENIVTMHAAWQEGDKVVMVQEYADGADLFSVMQKYGGRLSERLAVQLVLEPFLRVMHYLHSRGIIHRDIKPENILFSKKMVLKLGDFGLAIDLREERAVTRAGTLDYMAPEVLRCPFKSCPDENKDNAAMHYGAGVDTWAVGVMTYELCVGYPPFYSQTRSETEEQIVRGAPSFPRNLSDAAKDFINATLAKEQLRRPDVTQMLQHPWIDGYRVRRAPQAALLSPQQQQQQQQLARSASAAPGLAAAAAAAVAQHSVAQPTFQLPECGAGLRAMPGDAPKGRHAADGSVFVGARLSGEWRQAPVKLPSQRLDAHASLSY